MSPLTLGAWSHCELFHWVSTSSPPIALLAPGQETASSFRVYKQKSKIPFTQDCFLSTSSSSALVHLLFVLSSFQIFCWDSECEWNSRVLHIIESPFFPLPWQVNDILAGNWVLVYFLYILFQYPLPSRWEVWCQSYSYSLVDNFFFLSKTYKIFSLFL